MKREREDWSRLYHKTLKRLETMIDMQRMTKDIKKLAEEANAILTEVEGTILKASNNNQILNATNITQISEKPSILSPKQHGRKIIPSSKDVS